MPKIKLDIKNLNLIKELEKDSRNPLSIIAKNIKTSKEVAHYRFNKLAESGLIKRFDTIVDYFALGYNYYRLIINLQNLKYEIRKNIIKDLRKEKRIDLNIYLSSDWDLEINFWVKYSSEFYEFYNNLINKYAEFINEKEIYIITKTYIASHSYLHNNNKVITLGETKELKSIDEIDEKIIEELEINPIEDVVAISKKLNMAVSTIHYRIKQLKINGIIKGCIPILEKSLIGYNTYRVKIVLANPSKKREFISYLLSQKNVIKINELIGNEDLDFEVDFRTTQELDKFLEETRLKVPQIKDFEVVNIVTED